MKKLLTLTLILTLAIAVVATAQPAPRVKGCCENPCCGPQGKHEGMRMGGQRGNPGIRGILAHGDEINLTDQQRDQLENMMTEFQTQQVDQKAALQKARIQLKALMRDEADQGKINSAIDKAASLKAEIQKARYAHRQKVKAVLTAEQIEKLKSLKKKAGCSMQCKPGGKAKGPAPGGIDG